MTVGGTTTTTVVKTGTTGKIAMMINSIMRRNHYGLRKTKKKKSTVKTSHIINIYPPRFLWEGDPKRQSQKKQEVRPTLGLNTQRKQTETHLPARKNACP